MTGRKTYKAYLNILRITVFPGVDDHLPLTANYEVRDHSRYSHAPSRLIRIRRLRPVWILVFNERMNSEREYGLRLVKGVGGVKSGRG